MQKTSTKTKVFGPPGSGKTTYLLNIVEQELQQGTHPTKIGYFAFTRKAATEARERALTKFPALSAQHDFPWFRTLHSLAYQCLGTQRKDMMQAENFQEFANEAGLEIKVSSGEEDFIVNSDHPILNEINIARIKGEDLRYHYDHSGITIEWYHFEYVERAYRQYKARTGLMDFTDLLEGLIEVPARLPSLDALIIDEAQDLSRLQWRLVEELTKRASRLYLAGDDDQALYSWAGADVESFLRHDGNIIILDQSYRVPAKIHHLANNVVQRIRHRQSKQWKPREETGSVMNYNQFEHVDVSQGEWLILAATNYMLNDIHHWLVSQGLLFERHGSRSVPESVLQAVVAWEQLRKGNPVTGTMVRTIYKYLGSNAKASSKHLLTLQNDNLYTLNHLKQHFGLLTDAIWHTALVKIAEDKRRYIIAMLRRGIKVTGRPSIRLSTIHGAKGGEADNVLLLTDLSTKFSLEQARNPDNINRILYVALTRARKSLHLVLPKNAQKSFLL